MRFHFFHTRWQLWQTGSWKRDRFITNTWMSAPKRRAHGGTYEYF